MTTSHKAALSLLISVLLFGGFSILAFTGLFDFIETRFYDPSITASVNRDLAGNANVIDKFIAETQTQFSETLILPAIRRSFLPNQGAEDIFERSRIYGLLSESIRGLQWVRFIDSGGHRIHYSTLTSDIQQQDRLSIAYRNFEDPGYSYEKIAVADNGNANYIFDEDRDRILFSFPFYDSFDVYRGTALFSLSVRAVTDKLITDGRIKVGQDISVISDPKGFLSGMTTAGERVLPVQVSTIWKEGWQKTGRLVSPTSGLSLALITVTTEQGLLVGRLVNEEMFLFPLPMKIILLVSFFLTVYLITFLLFNLRQDSVTIVQNRLKQLQISLIEQFYDRKGEVDWARWSRELDQRRDEISNQLKLGIKVSSAQSKDLDTLIDKSWDELLAVMGGRSQFSSRESGIDEEKLQIILNRILAALPQGNFAADRSLGPQVTKQDPGIVVNTVPQTPVRDSADEEEAELADVEELAEELSEDLIEELAEEQPEELTEVLSEILSEEFSEEQPEELPGEPPEELMEELAEEKVEEKAEEIKTEETPEEIKPIEITDDLSNEQFEEVEAVPELNEADEIIEEIPEIAEITEIEEIEEVPDEAFEPVAAAGPPETESTDVPIIDVVDINMSVAAADEVVHDINTGLGDEAELEDLGEMESLDETERSEATPASPTIEQMVSIIEHSTVTEADNSRDFSLGDFEIVSPFSTLTFDFSTTDDGLIFLEENGVDENSFDSPAAMVEDVSLGPSGSPEILPHSIHSSRGKDGMGLFLIGKTFMNSAKSERVENLDSFNEGNDDDIPLIEVVSGDDNVIEEREGVPYINEEALIDGEKAQSINKDFKDLVDSVIK